MKTTMAVKRKGRGLQLERRVLNFIRENKLVTSNRLVVGVSGGPDSVCLLHLLSSLRLKLDLELHVAHLNHQLRGIESEDDAQYVARLAQRLDLPVTIESRNVESFRKEQRCSLEEAAREVRYMFLAETAEAISAHQVAVGHTSDDQVETILMHIIRGSGTRGLRGLKPVSLWQSEYNDVGVKVIRPLLEVSREETVAYCHIHGLEPRIDSSNHSAYFFRNRIRGEILPLLSQYNPQLKNSLLQLSRIADHDYAFVEEQTLSKWPEVAREAESNITLDIKKLLGLPLALKRTVLYLALERLCGSPKDIEAVHIEQMIAALDKPAGSRLSLPGNVTFYKGYDHCSLALPGGMPSPFPHLGGGEITLNIPGTTSLSGWRVEAILLSSRPVGKGSLFTAYLDQQAAGTTLIVRGRRKGDIFQPLGMNQSKKLQDFMVDAKIPRHWRDHIPLVCSPEKIIWVVGYRCADTFVAGKEGSPVLSIEFIKVNSEW